MTQLMSETRAGMGVAGRLIHRDPILVCGVPRSGTSWTAKVLSLGGKIRYMREPLSHGGYAAESGQGGVPYLTAEDDSPAYEEVWRRVFSLDPLFGRRWILGHSQAWLQKVPFWPARLLIKEVNCPLALDWLSARFPMRIVITTRHPCGYVASGLRLHKVGHDVVELAQLLEQPRLMDEFSPDDRAWLAALEDPVACLAAAYGIVYKVIAGQMVGHPEWTLVRHESLCRDPAGEFAALCRAVGLTYNRRIENYLNETTTSSDPDLYSLKRVSSEEPDKWKSELSGEQIDAVASVVSRFDLPFYRDFA